MPGTTIGTSMNYGYPGSFSRNGDCIIRNRLVNPADSSGPNFGKVVVLIPNATGGYVSDLAVFIAASGTFSMSNFGGFASREIKSFESYAVGAGAGPSVGNYAPNAPCDYIERGSISLVVKDPQAAGYAAGGKIYARVSTNGSFPSAAVGDLETASDSSHTVQITNAFLDTGLVDANSVCEVTLVTRNLP